ncbi:transcriptional repressor TCF25-domain-containing protein [Russula vinacea]|nr:transcriptional repressor TCF25-domain-containing protein [Russula vinacea]
MPARLSKRQQRELEELTHADEIEQAGKSSEDEDEGLSVTAQSAFAALLKEGGASTEEDSAPEEPTTSSKAKKKSKKKKKKGAQALADGVSTVQGGSVQVGDKLTESHSTTAKTGTVPVIPSTSSLPAGTSKKERKALKKQKAKAKKEGDDDFDRVLDELSNKYRDTYLARKGLSRSLPEECFKLLSMRRFFGAKVIATSRNEDGPSSRARRQPIAQRSFLTHPRPTWWPAKLREGLTLRPLTDDEAAVKASLAPWDNTEEKFWTAEYSKKYKGATRAFLQTVLSGDPEGFNLILHHVRWHADTILQLAELYIHHEEHSQAADFIERALFTYERAFVGAFTFTNGLNRLDFDRVENRPFFLALHRQVIDLQRRGLYRTAFEFAKLLLSLDPWSDPHGAYLHLDFLAIKCSMDSWLLSYFEIFSPDISRHQESQSCYPPVCALPGWAYARALAFRAQGDDHAAQHRSLETCILEFPSVVPLLADKAELCFCRSKKSAGFQNIHSPRVSNDLAEESLLHLLSSWFAETVTELVRTGRLPPKATATAGFTRLQSLVRRSDDFDISIYRHVVILGSSAQRLLPFIPAHIINKNNLACDPLPPPSFKSQYNDEFFRGAEDVFATTFRHRSAAQTQRVLERMVPDPELRRRLQEQFPEGIIQFVQEAGNLPEEVLMEIMANPQILEEAAAQGALPHGEMPGGLPGDNLIRLDFVEEADIEIEREDPTAAGAAPVADEALPALEEDEEEDEDFEEIAPLHVRVLRNLVNRFWGGSNAEEEGSSDDGSQRAELDGVD